MFIPAGSAGPDLGGLSAAWDMAGLLGDRLHGCTELVGPQHPFPMALVGTTGCVTRGRGLWARGERFVRLTSCNKPALAGAELSCLALEHSPAAFPELEHPRLVPPRGQPCLPCRSPHRLQLSSNRDPQQSSNRDPQVCRFSPFWG